MKEIFSALVATAVFGIVVVLLLTQSGCSNYKVKADAGGVGSFSLEKTKPGTESEKLLPSEDGNGAIVPLTDEEIKQREEEEKQAEDRELERSSNLDTDGEAESGGPIPLSASQEVTASAVRPPYPTVQCLDTLGGNKYCDLIGQTVPAGTIIGFFLNVDGFGNAGSCISRLAAMGKFPAIRIHLRWEDDHTVERSQYEAIAKTAQQVQNLQDAYPGTQFIVGGVAEHRMSTADVNDLSQRITRYAPRVKQFNVPWTGAIMANWINETHGENPKDPKTVEWFVSYDGTAAVDSDVSAWKNRTKAAGVQCIWDTRLNGKYDKDTTPRPQRTNWPDSRYMSSLVRLTQPKGTPPAFFTVGGRRITFQNWPSNWLWKTHAEDTGSRDVRRDKPMFLTTVKTSRVTVISSTGRNLCDLTYYGTYDGGRYRYYSGHRGGCNLLGYQIGDKGKALGDSEWVGIQVGSRYYGPINPAFRHGFFQD